MGQVKPPFVIAPHILKKLAEENKNYIVIVSNEDEERVRETMSLHPEIKVIEYTEMCIDIIAKPGKVYFVGIDEIPPILWEARRSSAVSAFFNKPIC